MPRSFSIFNPRRKLTSAFVALALVVPLSVAAEQPASADCRFSFAPDSDGELDVTAEEAKLLLAPLTSGGEDAAARVPPKRKWWFLCTGPGGRVWAPRSGNGGAVTLPAPKWGAPTHYKAVKITYSTTRYTLQSLIDHQKVPNPNPNSRKAKKERNVRYRLYVVNWDEPTLQHTWKYGISRADQGERRPKTGRKDCLDYIKRDYPPWAYNCHWRWVRKNKLVGYYQARLWEAGYIAQYKRILGYCPPGQRKSCM